MNENLTPQIVTALLQDGTVKMTGEEIASAIADAIGALDKPYRFRGVATPGLAPGKIFEPTLYVAVASATYGPFSNQSVDKGQIVFFTSDDGAFWSDVVAYCGGDGCPEPPGPDPALSEYFTIEAKDPAVVKFYRSAYGESYGDFKVEASTDGGQTWNEVTATADGAAVASLSPGEKVLLRGTNERYGYYDEDEGDTFNLANFGADGKCYVYGNIMSLVGGDNFAQIREVKDSAFAFMFADMRGSGWMHIQDGKELCLPAITLAPSCYVAMFAGCKSLTATPELPATTLADGCYKQMFVACTSLTKAPSLPATNLAKGCYSGMFEGCSSLTAPPELPALELTDNCYSGMFEGCSSLTAPPELPALELTDNCYSGMFKGCTSLEVAPKLPSTALEQGCYASMFEGCTGLTTAPALPAITLAPNCYAAMFAGCTSLTATPELPATILLDFSYLRMFANCSALREVTCHALDLSGGSATDNWLKGVNATGTFKKAAGVNWPTGEDGIPEGWNVVEA